MGVGGGGWRDRRKRRRWGSGKGRRRSWSKEEEGEWEEEERGGGVARRLSEEGVIKGVEGTTFEKLTRTCHRNPAAIYGSWIW